MKCAHIVENLWGYISLYLLLQKTGCCTIGLQGRLQKQSSNNDSVSHQPQVPQKKELSLGV